MAAQAVLLLLLLLLLLLFLLLLFLMFVRVLPCLAPGLAGSRRDYNPKGHMLGNSLGATLLAPVTPSTGWLGCRVSTGARGWRVHAEEHTPREDHHDDIPDRRLSEPEIPADESACGL